MPYTRAMDPLTQGLLGAAAAQAAYGRSLPRSAWLIGFGAGMLADVDVFFRVADPVQSLLLHRHFTHSLLFVATGGFLAAATVMWLPAFRGRRNEVLGAAIVAYLTHPLLDACTSYGTLLYWPFSPARVAWDVVSVIDPIFTLILLVGVAWAAATRARKPATVALIAAIAYLGLGWVQHERVEAAQHRLAAERGHAILRGRVMPTLGNVLLWRSLYHADDGRLYADAIRLLPWASPDIREGESVEHFDLAGIETGDEATDHALAGYARFADYFTAWLPGRDDVIADMRYSRDPAGFSAIWGVEVREFTIVPVGIQSSRDNLWPDLRERLWEVVNGFDVETVAAERAGAGDAVDAGGAINAQ